MEFVSPEGLRIDGRRPQELRAVQCHFKALSACDGSALFQAGNTKVEFFGILLPAGLHHCAESKV